MTRLDDNDRHELYKRLVDSIEALIRIVAGDNHHCVSQHMELLARDIGTRASEISEQADGARRKGAG